MGHVFLYLVEVCLALLVLLFNMVGLVLSWLPGLVSRGLWLAQLALAVSCDIYRRLLTWLRPLGFVVGVDLVANPWRLVACVLLSVLVGLVIIVLAHWPVTPLGLGLCAGHGVLVAVVWDQLGPPTGVRMGVH